MWRHKNLKNSFFVLNSKQSTQSKATGTIVNDSFSWETTKTTFPIKTDNSVTSRNSE